MKYRHIFALLFVLILSLTACGREQVPPPVKGQPPGFLSKEGKYWMTCVKGRRRTAVSVP